MTNSVSSEFNPQSSRERGGVGFVQDLMGSWANSVSAAVGLTHDVSHDNTLEHGI